MENWFRALFKSNPPAPAQDNYLARLLGLFSEEIVRIWCAAPQSPYRDLGRPRVVVPPSTKGYTLDFTLQSTQHGHNYVAEMKCWPAYQNYRYLTLRDAEQLQACEDSPFDAFLAVAAAPSRCKVSVGGEPQPMSGAILIWSDVTESGRTAVRQAYHLTTVLSLREIIDDLVTWEDERYQVFLKERLGWCQRLFYGLATRTISTRP